MYSKNDLGCKSGQKKGQKVQLLKKKILHSSCHFRAVIFGKVQKLLILIFEANCEFPKLDFILFLSQRCDHDRRNKSEKFFAGMEWKHRMKLSLKIQFNY